MNCWAIKALLSIWKASSDRYLPLIRELVRQNERYREALEYYGNDKHWLRGGNMFNPTSSMYVPVGGMGGVAKKALQETLDKEE